MVLDGLLVGGVEPTPLVLTVGAGGEQACDAHCSSSAATVPIDVTLRVADGGTIPSGKGTSTPVAFMHEHIIIEAPYMPSRPL